RPARRPSAAAGLQVRGRRPDRHSASRGDRRARPRRGRLRVQGPSGGGYRDGAARRPRRAHRRPPQEMTPGRPALHASPVPLLIALSALAALGARPAAGQTGLSAAMPAPPAAVVGVSDARSGPDPELREKLKQAIAEARSFPDRFEAEVWLTDMSSRLSRQVEDPDERLEILKSVHWHARQVGLEPELVLAVIDVESNFDRFAISSAGALGLMQVMPFWVKELEEELGYQDKNVLFKIDTNVLMGCWILKHYLEMERYDLVRGLARYNGSVGQTWYADRVIQRLNRKWYRF